MISLKFQKPGDSSFDDTLGMDVEATQAFSSDDITVEDFARVLRSLTDEGYDVSARLSLKVPKD